MARVGTPNLNLGMYVDGEDPGSGPQGVDSLFLNGDKMKIDTALGAEHNPSGTHKDDKIDGRTLKATVADASTLEFSASSGAKALRVKDDGIDGIKLKSSVADDSTLEFSASSGAKTIRAKNDGLDGIKLKSTVADGSTLEFSASSGAKTLRIKDGGVTGAKISHDNTRTKIKYSLAFAAKTVGTFAKYHGELTSASLGIPMLRDGKITRIMCTNAGGAVVEISAPYASGGLGSFAEGDRLNAQIQAWTSDDYVTVNNINDATNYTSGFESTVYVTGWTAPIFVEIEAEFD